MSSSSLSDKYTIGYVTGIRDKTSTLKKANGLKKSMDDTEDGKSEIKELQKFEEPIIVTTDAIISGGKTTFLKATHRIHDMYSDKESYDLYTFPEDGYQGKPLVLVLTDPKKYSGQFQTHMIQHCMVRFGVAKAKADVYKQFGKRGLFLVDRSTEGNLAFAILNYFLTRDGRDGIPNIKDYEMNAYMTFYSSIEVNLGDVNLFLWSSPDVCKSRIEKRALEVEVDSYVKEDKHCRYLWQLAYVQMFWLLSALSTGHIDTTHVVLDWNKDTPLPSVGLSAILQAMWMKKSKGLMNKLYLHKTHFGETVPFELHEDFIATYPPYSYEFWTDSFYAASPSFPSKEDKDTIKRVMNLLCQLRDDDIHLYLPPETPIHPFTFSYETSTYTPLTLTFID